MARKILWLPKWYPHKMIPEDGNFVETHARCVAAVEDLAILFVHSDMTLSQGYDIRLSRDPEAGFPIVHAYYALPKGWYAPLLHVFRYWRAQIQGYRQLKAHWGEPDLLHLHVLSRTGLLAEWLRKPYVITEHASRYLLENMQFTGTLRRLWTRRLIRHSKEISTVSYALQKAMESHGLKGKYVRISNVVDTAIFKPYFPKEAPITPWQWVHISHLRNAHKNPRGILEACSLLKSNGHSFHMHMIGESEEREEHMAYADALGLGEMITWYGNVSPAQIATHLKQADAFVMFSNHETQSVVSLEALACGTPIVATPVYGLAEHLKPEFGVSVAPKDVSGLADALVFTMKNWQNFDRNHMHRYVHQLGGKEAVSEAFAGMYTRALGSD